MKSSPSVIDVIEESLGEALNADLIAHVDRLTVEDVERLKAGYDEFAHAGPLRPAAGEFWPISHRLIPKDKLERSQEVADTAAQKAMSQLLYAHGAVVPDRLGNLLAHAINPESHWSKGPSWEAKNASIRNILTNYLEALAFLRPLVDAELLILQPQTVKDLGFFPERDFFYTDADSRFDELGLSTIEFELGRDARLKFEKELERTTKVGGILDYGSVLSGWNPERHFATADTFEFLFRKFTDLARGFPGHLNLESPQEREVFAWLVEQGNPSPAVHPEIKNLLTADSLIAPSLSDLQPADVIAMHQSDVWLEYRLTLRRGLDRVSGLDDLSKEEALAIVREEMRLIEESAARTNKRSRFVEARANAGRDLAIGAVVAGGTAPMIGLSSAAIGLTVGTAHTASAFLWSWLCSGGTESERAVARCFAALG